MSLSSLLLVFWLMWFFAAFLANEIKICRRGILKSKRQCFMVHSFQALPMDP